MSETFNASIIKDISHHMMKSGIVTDQDKQGNTNSSFQRAFRVYGLP